MSDPEERERRSKRRKRNLISRSLRESGAFKPKIENPKKGGHYKREHLSVRDLEKFIEEENIEIDD